MHKYVCTCVYIYKYMYVHMHASMLNHRVHKIFGFRFEIQLTH